MSYFWKDLGFSEVSLFHSLGFACSVLFHSLCFSADKGGGGSSREVVVLKCNVKALAGCKVKAKAIYKVCNKRKLEGKPA